MRQMLAGALMLSFLAVCFGASSEEATLAFGDGAPQLRSSIAARFPEGSESKAVGEISYSKVGINDAREVASARRGVTTRKLFSRYAKHDKHFQQLTDLYSPTDPPYRTSAEDGTAYAAPQQDSSTTSSGAQPTQTTSANALWTWRPSIALQAAPATTDATDPASAVQQGKGAKQRQRRSEISELQPMPQQQKLSQKQQQQQQQQQQTTTGDMHDQGQPVLYVFLSPTYEEGDGAAAEPVLLQDQLQDQTVPTASVDVQQLIKPAASLDQPGLQAGDQAVLTTGNRLTKRRRRAAVMSALLAAADTTAAAAGPAQTAPEAVLSMQPELTITAASTEEDPVLDHDALVQLVQAVPLLSPPPTPSLSPSPLPSPSPSPLPSAPSAPQQAKFCIPATRGMQFNVLAAGDSITQGSVPSKMINHPYTIVLSQLLRQRLGKNADATDAGLGGGGIFMDGFNNPVKFSPYYLSYLSQVEWNVAVITIGINDLLRGGYPAADIMAGLQPLYDQTLAKGIPIIAIPPFAAPGFVSQTDSKETERKKLVGLIADAAAKRQAATGGKGPQITVLDLQAGPLDFWKMTDTERSQYLDDGLHLTESAYDKLGQYVYQAVNGLLCSVQNPTITIPIPDPKLILQP